MNLAAWLEKPVSAKQVSRNNIRERERDYFFREVALAFNHNESEFSRGASRDRRMVDPMMVELLP